MRTSISSSRESGTAPSAHSGRRPGSGPAAWNASARRPPSARALGAEQDGSPSPSARQRRCRSWRRAARPARCRRRRARGAVDHPRLVDAVDRETAQGVAVMVPGSRYQCRDSGSGAAARRCAWSARRWNGHGTRTPAGGAPARPMRRCGSCFVKLAATVRNHPHAVGRPASWTRRPGPPAGSRCVAAAVPAPTTAHHRRSAPAGAARPAGHAAPPS